jgi:eukaryotic-like serine/threonine-protein kinase
MSSITENSTFADTTMDSQSGQADPGSYGYLGRYRLDRMIGHGAMGAVFEAFDSTLGRTIAIKTLYTQPEHLSNGFDNATVDAAILQEARTAATLNHPHIVTVYDAGRAPSSMLKRELPYVAMELLQGTDLRQRISTGPRMGQREAVALVGKLALALDHAHKSGVVHRDIKPANVFITKNNSPKILDFGLARFTARAVHANNGTHSGLVAGSPQYMSPEMVLSIRDSSVTVDARSDVYSLGVILYELLCGKQPFTAPTLELLQERITHTPAENPHHVDPTIPHDLANIMMHVLAKKPADRYRSAGQLARELRRWGAGMAEAEAADAAHMSAPMHTPSANASRTSGFADLQTKAASNPAHTRTRSAWPWMIAVVVVATAGALWLWQAQPGKVPAAAPMPARAVAAKTPAESAVKNVAVPAPVSTAALSSPSQPDSTLSTSAATTPAAAVSATTNTTAASKASAATAAGRLRLAVTPWGAVEVDGKKMGVSPPLTVLTLEPGEHTIVLSNSDFAPRTFRVNVEAGKTERVAHRFE